MSRIMAPDRGAIEMDVGSTRYRQPNPHNGGGAVVVDNPEHERILLKGGCFRASANPISRQPSHGCRHCAKRMWIRPPAGPRICMKCGNPEGTEPGDEREDRDASTDEG